MVRGRTWAPLRNSSALLDDQDKATGEIRRRRGPKKGTSRGADAPAR
jgi:hypothetical protein